MRRVLLSLLFLSVGLLLYAQEPVRFGDREVYLEEGVAYFAFTSLSSFLSVFFAL